MWISSLINVRSLLSIFLILSGATLYLLCIQIISERLKFNENIENKIEDEEKTVSFNLEHCNCKR